MDNLRRSFTPRSFSYKIKTTVSRNLFHPPFVISLCAYFWVFISDSALLCPVLIQTMRIVNQWGFTISRDVVSSPWSSIHPVVFSLPLLKYIQVCNRIKKHTQVEMKTGRLLTNYCDRQSNNNNNNKIIYC